MNYPLSESFLPPTVSQWDQVLLPLPEPMSFPAVQLAVKTVARLVLID